MEAVTITFQGPDFSGNTPTDVNVQPSFKVAGYDDDYGTITVYSNFYDGMNRRLAVKAPYMNENGDDCGEIGWRIDPDEDLLAMFPDIPHIGAVYGRVIVTVEKYLGGQFDLRGYTSESERQADEKYQRTVGVTRVERDGYTLTIDPTRDNLPYGAPKNGETGHVLYVVVFARDAGSEMIEDEGVPVEGVEPRKGVEQLANELQEAYDIGGVAGHFQITHRITEGAVETVAEMPPVAPVTTEPESCEVFDIIVRSKDGRDLTGELASHDAIDGSRTGIDTPGKALGSLSKLDPDTAVVTVSQIIDQGWDNGSGRDDQVDAQRTRMAKFIREDGGSLGECVTPDGWTIYVIRFIEVTA